MTGIPVSGIGKGIQLEALKKSLERKIIGQSKAIDVLCEAVMRSELGINSPDRPKGVFLFLGSSGVGKTELAKTLAENLFFNKNSFFTFDMSEFSEKNSVNKFIGSPPGYVGYEDGGNLTEKIRRHPYSVILFDEIEKAHNDVLDLFLQIADSGTLTDAQGRSVNFKNCYIILTSNIGAKSNEKSVGFVKSDTQSKEKIREMLKEHFRIEFINRIDEIVPFSLIDTSTMAEIAERKLHELSERLKAIGIIVSFTAEVAFFLAEKCTDENFGVRELIRLITNEVENKISSHILNSNKENGHTLLISLNNSEILITEKAAAQV